MPSSVGDSGELESVVLGTFFGFIDQSAASLGMHFVTPMTPRVISVPLLGSNGVRAEYQNALTRQGDIPPPLKALLAVAKFKFVVRGAVGLVEDDEHVCAQESMHQF